ncbi:adenine deaminase C-terminal domain-containing protein [Fictibacillus phosphorivorans]|uniref:adenine deaminase C-terminal domain-containing protein n=1 Tax=Fictibacillus phosphorivorans TaxID=1221500 RepID=UPI001293D0D7|nr:adenine deaminase C-terminal domain-containing protein [Fictibacillus phosphorivorans]MQR93909.1 adenine deaminase [Fictibacillus phosphorivorans]
MNQHIAFWTKAQMRKQVAVIQGELAPSLVLTNATYLNTALKKWVKANIWILQDRIVYVGEKMPEHTTGTEITDLEGKFVVPGYIEPHCHPFQLYNPQSLSRYALQRGTSVFLADNFMLLFEMNISKALSFMEDVNDLPSNFFWWCRYDAQTELLEEENYFSEKSVRQLLESPYVLQGGELTSWPRVLHGDDTLLHWMLKTKKAGKKIEGHLPGASEKTLTAMTLLGVDCDHEAMTGTEVMDRLNAGLQVSLRYSSIRPDLPKLLSQMKEKGITNYERIFMTTDGSTPAFYEEGVTDKMLEIALEAGLDSVDAYMMVSYNVARYYGLDHLFGMIAAGRVAHLNILDDVANPLPESVLAKGKWMKRDGKDVSDDRDFQFDWDGHGIKKREIKWDLQDEDFQFSGLVGIEMYNSVITRPYNVSINPFSEEINGESDECFLMLIDKEGKWRINTVVKGFAKNLYGFASSYSNTGDLLIIGKSKKDMAVAFERLKEVGGGIVLAERGEIVAEIKLPLAGGMSNLSIEELVVEEKRLTNALRERGYQYEDPIYSLLFFSSTHLPYIRITQRGIYDVKKKGLLFPSIMR